MRFDKWKHSFDERADDPLVLAERLLARPARLVQTWTDEAGRELRLYVPSDDEVIMATDEIVTCLDDGQWRRVMFADRPR